MKRNIDIAGVAVEIAAADAIGWGPVDALFGPCLDTDEPPELTLRHGFDVPALPDRAADQASPELAVWFDEDGVSARHASGLCARRIADRIVAGGSGGRDPVRAFRLATQPPLIDALARHGRHALHAASLEHGGAAVVVLGGSGAGKSTFAFAGARSGWRIVADDLSLVYGTTPTFVSGLPKPVNVPADVLGAPPEGSLQIPDDDRRRWVLPASVIGARSTYPVRAVVLVGHSADEAAIVETPPSPARLERLIAALPLGLMPSALRAYFPVAAALSRLPAFVYRHPRDPAERAGAAAALLAQLETLDPQ
jgi:hypothetical protein